MRSATSIRTAVLRRALATTALSVGLGAGALFTANAASAQDLPVGGTVVSGAATIGTGGGTTTVTQSTNRAIINWQSFDVGAGRAVVFAQPDAQSATLNRVTGGAASTIAGQISATGSVYLINPNGIAITARGNVQTGGGFVASTLDIADKDFNAGTLAFTGTGSSKSVGNAGTITAGQGAYVALLGGSVSNAGTITVPLGRVGLGSGESVALDLNGDGFMQVAVPTAALVDGNSALIEMAGTIAASGGRVELKTATVKDAVRNVINMTGTVNVDSAVGNGGTIILLGGDGGIVNATGTLSARATEGTGGGAGGGAGGLGAARTAIKATVAKDARGRFLTLTSAGDAESTADDRGTTYATDLSGGQARGTGGNGGFVETSGATVNFTGLKVDTSTASGTTGTWLIDPTDLTVDAAAATTISNNLATSNVTLQTTSTTASGPGNQSAGNGDITVNSAITWASANTLSLIAYNNIALNAAISGTSGALTLSTGNAVANTGTISTGAGGTVNIGTFRLNNGNWSQLTAALPAFAATDFRIVAANATFLRATGGTGAAGTPYTIGDIYGLQGMASYNLGTNSFLLTADLNAAGTAAWNGGQGFTPIGIGGAVFTGTFNGGSHTITGLTINRSGASNIGLFGYSNGALSNIGLVNVSIRGGAQVGALLGFGASPISNAYSTGMVLGTGNSVGGLAGYATGAVTNSYSTANVSGVSQVGGLAGTGGFGAFSNVYATGIVTGTGTDAGGLIGQSSFNAVTNAYASGAVNGVSHVGGLTGLAYGGSITSAYATGAVTGNAAGTDVGGLVGNNSTGGANPIKDSYATGTVRGGTSVGGLVGAQGASSITSSYSSGSVTALGSGASPGGFIGSNSGGTYTNDYFDSYSSGVATAAPASAAVLTGVTAVTSDPAQAAAANYAFKSTAYAGLTAASGLGTATPAGFVFLPGNSTRPFLAFEVPNANLLATVGGSLVIRNSHQLQLIGYNGTTLGASYILGNAIDLSDTGRATVGTPGSYSGMWAGTGWTPLGTDGAGNHFDGTGFTINGSNTGFSGSLNGGGFALDGLTIKRPTISSVALIGFGSGGQTISNLGLTNVAITGFNFTGALLGIGFNTIVNTVYSTGTVTGGSSVGGLIGYIPGGSITGSYSTANATGQQSVGGLVGSDYVATTNSYATGNVTGTGTGSSGQYIGGLAGDSFNAAFTNVYANGNVAGASNYIGGLIGWQNGGSVSGSHASIGTVTGVGTSNYLGGLIGQNVGTISNSYASGNVSGTSMSYVGGLSGEALGAISGSTASGTVSGGAYVGGLIGHVRGISVTSSSATGNVTGTASFVGGLVGGLENIAAGTTASVSGSFATGTVRGNGQVGGLVGYQLSSGGGAASVSGSYATGAVTATGVGLAYSGGLVGQIATASATANTRATIDTSYATGSVTAASTSSSSYVGGLVGAATNAAASVSITVGITNSYATGAVQSAGGNVGGLVGYTTGYTTLSGVNARGTVSGTLNVGGLAGQVTLNGVVINAYATGNVSATSTNIGGLIGQLGGASLSYAYATGTVSTTSATTTSNAGGLVGSSTGATARISNAYATGAVSSAGGYVGGLIGNLSTSGNAVTNVYATGSVTGTGNVGGLVGVTAAGTSITGAYASGFINAGSGIQGSLIGSHAGSLSQAYADSYSSGQGSTQIGALSGTLTQVINVTSDPNQSGMSNYAYNPASYTLLSGANVGTATVSGFVFAPGGSTRPFLAFEAPVAGNPGVVTNASSQIVLDNAHQLQLVNGYAATFNGSVVGTTLTRSYVLGGNIDLSETGRVVVGTPGSYSGMWSGKGFVALGSNGTDGNTNVWNGTGYGLLGSIAAGGTFGFSGAIDGGGFTLSGLGVNRPAAYNIGLIGVSSGALSNITVTGSIKGMNGVGLIGYQRSGTVTNVTSQVSVNGNNLIGGIVGNQFGGTITLSNSSGAISGAADIGGLVGYQSGTISRSSATGAISGVYYVGGLVGYGYNGTISDSYATGSATAASNVAGGLVGVLNGGSVTRSYSTGAVSALTNGGGLIGQNIGGTPVSSSYWNTQTSGYATSAGGTSRTTTQLQDMANYGGWDFTTIWSPPTPGTYPALRK